MKKKPDLEKAIRLMGRAPINPVGQCFDSAAWNFVGDQSPHEPGDRLCHGVGTANMPGQEGSEMAHAWIEFDHPKLGRVAWDSTWGIHERAEAYRKGMSLTYVVEYTRAQVLVLWKLHNMPGPWDLRIRAITERKKE